MTPFTQQYVKVAICGLALFSVLSRGDTMEIRYPTPHTLIQRETPVEGKIPIRGLVSGASIGDRVQARFSGGEWQELVVDANTKSFSGTIIAKTGQGKLEVRSPDTPQLNTTVEPVAVGDLFVIAGQSNADGRGTEHVKLNDTNPTVGVKYAKGAWSEGSDPSCGNLKYGSPWPIVLNELIPELNIPIGFIQTAVGSTVVKQWHRGGNMFDRMLKMIKAATDGTMKVKAICYYQGENDITHYNKLTVLGDYAEYKENLLAVATDMEEALHAPILVGQITNLISFRERNDNIRRAQQEIWAEHRNARRGAVTYDIFPTDGVHYRDLANMTAFAHRWTLAIRESVYGASEYQLPTLKQARQIDATTLKLTFDRPITISSWDGKVGNKALGFRFTAGETTLTDADIVSTIVNKCQVTVTLAKSLPTNARLCYGSGNDGQGKSVLRDAENGQPITMIFGVPVTTD